MCLSVPAQIKSVNGLEAEIELGGATRHISLWLLPEAQPGDYVSIHAGFAISIVDEAEALESLRLLRELAETHPDELFISTSDLPSSKSG